MERVDLVDIVTGDVRAHDRERDTVRIVDDGALGRLRRRADVDGLDGLDAAEGLDSPAEIGALLGPQSVLRCNEPMSKRTTLRVAAESLFTVVDSAAFDTTRSEWVSALTDTVRACLVVLKTTIPSFSANRVSSLPRPTSAPGWN